MANSFDVLSQRLLRGQIDIDSRFRGNYRTLEFPFIFLSIANRLLRLGNTLRFAFALLPFDQLINLDIRDFARLILDHGPILIVVANELDNLSVL